MTEKKFSAILLQPHDTPLSQLLTQHRRIREKLLQSHHALPREYMVYPQHPCHCLVQSSLEIQQLKQRIRSCTIMPPVFSRGFLLRPVALEGEELESMALHSILPHFLQEVGGHRGIPAEKIPPERLPGGFVFGCIKNRNDGKTVEKMNPTDETMINGIIDSFELEPLKLRVFRLHSVEYRWNQGEIPEALNWTLESPLWVKLKP